MARLLSDELGLTHNHNLILGESRILAALADDLAHIGRVSIEQRQVKVPLVLGQRRVDDELLQAVDIVRFLALQHIDILELTILDFLVQGGKSHRFAFSCHSCRFVFSRKITIIS